MDTIANKATPIVRVAMWSGPRNISTAMMRSWENRADTFVSDEPFYAHYLHHTGLEHPGRDDIIASQPSDWQSVAKYCTQSSGHSSGHNSGHSSGDTRAIHYQKHMTQHMLPHIKLDWLQSLHNIFLIRSPDAVVASYAKSRPDLTASDLGFEQQARLYNHVKTYINDSPLVIESSALLEQPTRAIELLCQHVGIPFDKNMLQWPAGKRKSDGIWAPYWYKNVELSTGFSAPPSAQKIQLSPALKTISEQCREHYELMAENAVRF